MNTKIQNRNNRLKTSKSKLLKLIGAFFLIILIIFVGNKLNYQAKIDQTLKELDDPMISKDLLGMKLEEQYVSPESEWMKGKYTGPYVVNYFSKPSGKSDVEILDEIMALAEKNGWTVVEIEKDNQRISFFAEKNQFKLFVRVAEYNAENTPDSNPRSDLIRLAIQRPTKL